MPYAVGVLLALAASVYARLMRLDRDRAFYPTVLIVVALYDVLFAVMGGDAGAIRVEILIAGGFVLLASLGFKRNLGLVAAGLAAHGVLDAVHGREVSNPGVPLWWPAFCGAYDVAAAAFLSWTFLRSTSPTARDGASLAASAR